GNCGKATRLSVLRRRFAEVEPAPDGASRDGSSRSHAEGEIVGARKLAKDLRRYPAQNAMCRGMIGSVRRDAKRCPGGIRLGVGIAIGVGLPDGGDRPPERVVALPVPAGDEAIHHRGVQHRLQKGSFVEAVAEVTGHDVPNAAPATRGWLSPEVGVRGLVLCAHRAGAASHRLHLVELPGVVLTRQRMRRLDEELVAAVEYPRGDVLELGLEQGEEARWGRLPNSWTRGRVVRIDTGVAVVDAGDEDELACG